MFLIKYKDGSFKEVEDLNPNQPDLDLLEGMERVYQVNREWVPQMVLRPKPKAERQQLRREGTEPEAPATSPQPESPAPQQGSQPAEPSGESEPELIQVSFL